LKKKIEKEVNVVKRTQMDASLKEAPNKTMTPIIQQEVIVTPVVSNPAPSVNQQQMDSNNNSISNTTLEQQQTVLPADEDEEKEDGTVSG